jgi:hypothetical protein
VCRHLNERIEAVLFSHITIDVALHGADTAAAQLEALASGSSRASDFAKNLLIRSVHIVPQDGRDVDVLDGKKMEVAMVQVRKNLLRAVMSLKNVTSVSLVIRCMFCFSLAYLPIAGAL